MYRHFAVLTVAITALMAFFADGENQKAVAAAGTGEPRAAPRPAPAAPRLETDADADPGTWGSDGGEDFGQPAFGSSADGGAWASNPFGLTRGHRSSTDGDKTSLTARDGDEPENGEVPEAPTAAQIVAAAAASRLRSGGGND